MKQAYYLACNLQPEFNETFSLISPLSFLSSLPSAPLFLPPSLSLPLIHSLFMSFPPCVSLPESMGQ